MSILVAPTHRTLADDVIWARSAWQRSRGLLGRQHLVPGQALVIVGAHQVHTFGMQYPIDVLFCDRAWVVRHGVVCMRPLRMTRWVPAARYAIELRAGVIRDIRPGTPLLLTGTDSQASG
jgi:uncharacterized protein